MYTIAVIVGSLRKASINKKLARAVAEEGKDLFTFNIVPIDDVPLFNQDLEGTPPAAVVRMREAIAAADAVLFVTPEYNRGIPGVMKNITDWASRPYGAHCLAGKPAAVMGTSNGAVGTAVAQAQMRSMLTMLGMPLMRQPEMYITTKPDMINEAGGFTDDSTKKFMRGFLEGLNQWLVEFKKG